MKISILIMLSIGLHGYVLRGQTVSTGKATANGPCSTSHVGNNNSYVINCNGIGLAQGRKILELLNKILENQDLTLANAKLDELLQIASRPNVVIQAPVAQSSGDCAQNIVGGSNNTNNCAPKPVHISISQAEVVTGTLKATPGLSGTVRILYEYSPEGAEESARNLAAALDAAGIHTSVQGAMIMGNGCNPTHPLPGLSLDCVKKDDPLATAIAHGLVDAQIITPPVNATAAQSIDSILGIIIRRP